MIIGDHVEILNDGPMTGERGTVCKICDITGFRWLYLDQYQEGIQDV